MSPVTAAAATTASITALVAATAAAASAARRAAAARATDDLLVVADPPLLHGARSALAGPGSVTVRSFFDRTVGRVLLRRRIRERLPELVEALARELRGGSPLTEALVAAAQQSPEPFPTDAPWLQRRMERGEPVVDVLAAWARRHRSSELGEMASLLALGTRAGAALAAPLDGLAGSLAARRELSGEIDALTSSARASAVLLMALPVVSLALFAAADPQVRQVLLDPLGWVVIAAGLALDALGGWWLHMQVERVR